MIGHQLLLKLAEDAALLLRAGDDQLEGGQQILLVDRLAAQADSPQGGLVEDVYKRQGMANVKRAVERAVGADIL